MLSLPTTRPMLMALVLSMLQSSAMAADPIGFPAQPTSGVGSTSQFSISNEFGTGTSCGVKGFPNGGTTNNSGGGGPGYLYAAINELGFGSHSSAGPACGLCYELTPLNPSGIPQQSRALTFMIVDLCPAMLPPSSSNPTGKVQPLCNQCKIGQGNTYGQDWHFDIATDAMNSAQYSQFYQTPVTDTANDNLSGVAFTQVPCTPSVNPAPSLPTPRNAQNPGGGCLASGASTCTAADTASICAGLPATVTHNPLTGLTTPGPTAIPRMRARRHHLVRANKD